MGEFSKKSKPTLFNFKHNINLRYIFKDTLHWMEKYKSLKINLLTRKKLKTLEDYNFVLLTFNEFLPFKKFPILPYLIAYKSIK